MFDGQEQTEQGFNVNEDMLVENLKETSLIGQIIVSNHMSCFGIEIQVVKCAKYVAALEEKGTVKKKKKKKNWKLLCEEITYTKR